MKLAHLQLPNSERKSIPVEEGESLLAAIQKAGIFIRSSCGGHASCSDCVVKIKSGEDHLSAPPFEELQLLGNVFHVTKERLACQCLLSGEVGIDLSAHDEKVQSTKKSSFKRPSTRLRKKGESKKAIPSPEQERPKRLGGGKRPQLFSLPEDRTKSEREPSRQDFQKQREKSDKNES